MTQAVALVAELARQRTPVGIAEPARSLDLAKSTVANLCAALKGTRLIRRVDGGWALGYKVVELGQAFLSGTDTVREFRRLAVGATLLTARLMRKPRGELVSGLTSPAAQLARTAAV